MNKKVSLGVTISAMAVVCALTFIVTSFLSLQRFNTKVQAVKEKAEKYSRLEALDTYVRENFYQEELDEQLLMDGILKGYVYGLDDPYSQYLTDEEYSALQQRDSGKSIGIGVTVQRTEEGFAEIVEVAEGSPAEASGLLAGDLIVAVEGKSFADMEYVDAVEMVRGDPDTVVKLTVRRDGKDKDYSITRKEFDSITVKSQLIDGHIGYIRILRFRENTDEQFREALEDIIANGADALLFDVRNNGGGLADSLQNMLDPLLPEGVIAVAEYRSGVTENIIVSDAEETDLPMIVLVNENSASAAELFAASLRDFKDAKLIGKKTFGKGVMQTTRGMADGGALTLTVATYRTTRSECYHGIGLEPDQTVETGEDTDIEAFDPETDPQLAAAVAAFAEKKE
ncbi:MAG: S41 family peptidase [Oscillospiraceae bacterium]|nr:S41 family peptidase [Oscillospiraceae bacterium]